jgi:signal transduction histidine kinase
VSDTSDTILTLAEATVLKADATAEISRMAKLLLAGTDGELNEEQKEQVGFILRSSESLIEMVNDLLDLSKIEAGKVGLRPDRFKVPALFAALRGMFKPLHNGDASR